MLRRKKPRADRQGRHHAERGMEPGRQGRQGRTREPGLIPRMTDRGVEVGMSRRKFIREGQG